MKPVPADHGHAAEGQGKLKTIPAPEGMGPLHEKPDGHQGRARPAGKEDRAFLGPVPRAARAVHRDAGAQFRLAHPAGRAEQRPDPAARTGAARGFKPHTLKHSGKEVAVRALADQGDDVQIPFEVDEREEFVVPQAKDNGPAVPGMRLDGGPVDLRIAQGTAPHPVHPVQDRPGQNR